MVNNNNNDVIVAFRCLGDQDGPRFLDGRTADGTVGLGPSIDGGFTGTRWKLTALTSGDPQQVTLECLGDQDGSRFLDGRTALKKPERTA